MAGDAHHTRLGPNRVRTVNPTIKRNLSIADGIILVAGAAVAMACYLEFTKERGFLNTWSTKPHLWLAQATVSVVLPLTLMMIPLLLRQPRPRRGRLWCQPGLLAEIAVAVSLIHFLLLWTLDQMLTGPGSLRSPEGLLGRTVLLLPSRSSCAVAATWAALALSGRWRAEKSWLDRTGRLVGFYWIVAPFVNRLSAQL
jgi:hypothetical protein